MPRCLVARRVAAVLIVSCVLTALSVAARAADGWERFEANDHEGARRAFQAVLKARPDDSSALRGMAILLRKEDDLAGVAQCLARVVRTGAAGWQGEAYWPILRDAADQAGQFALLDDVARAVVATPGARPSLRANAQLVLAQSAERKGARAEADAIWRKLGYVRAWRVIGPFDNPSKFGLDHPFTVEADLAEKSVHKGRDDRPIHWYPQVVMGRNGICEIEQSLCDHKPGVFYAATAVYSDAEQRCTLSLDSVTSAKVFVGGKQILVHKYTIETEVDKRTDSFLVPTTLAAGWNNVVVKLASDGSAPRFRLRFIGANGAALAGLKADPAKVSAARCQTADTPNCDGALVTLLRSQPETLEREIRIGGYQLEAGDLEGATATLRAALKRYPDNGYLHWLLSRVLTVDQQMDEAKAARAQAVKVDRYLALAEKDQLTDRPDALEGPEHVAKLKALVGRFPRSAELRWDLAYAQQSADLAADSLRTARAAVKLAPGPDMQQRLYGWLRMLERAPDADAALAAAAKLYPDNADLREAMAEALQSKGRVAEAMKAYQALLQGVLAKPEYHQALAELYQQKHDQVHAAQEWGYARKQRPQDAEVCTKLGDAVRELGKKAEAMELYRSAIALDPGSVQLRDKIRLLSGEKPVMDLVPGVQGQPIVAQALKDKGAASSVTVYLDEARTVVYPDAATLTRFHEIVKFNDASAAEANQSYAVPGSSGQSRVCVEVAKLTKADGKVQDLSRGYGGGGIGLPSVGAGDVLDLVYRVEDRNSGALGSRFWTEWHFDHRLGPVKQSRFVLITPKDLTFKTAEHRAVPKPKVSEQNGWRIAEWQATDVPACAEQELAPSRLDQGSWVDVSSVEDWPEIVRWYTALSGPRCVPDDRVRAKAVELTRDAKTQDDKVRAIVSFVRAIRYQTTPFRMSAYVPEEGKAVLRDQYADCKDKAALIVAMLSCAGIKAEMVLLSDRASSGTTGYLPSPRFTHAVARAYLDSGPMWIDGTADQLAYGQFPCVLAGVPALIISPETKDLMPVPAGPVEQSVLSVALSGDIKEDGGLAGELTLRATGTWGWAIRSIMKEMPKDKLDEFLREFATETIKGSSYVSGSVDGQENPDGPIVVRAKITASDFATEAGPFRLVRLPTAQWLSSRTAEAFTPAQYPNGIELSTLRGISETTVRLRLPAGYTAPDLVASVQKETPSSAFAIQRSLDGGVLNVRQTLTVRALRVEPADVATFGDVLKQCNKEGDKPIVLKKAG